MSELRESADAVEGNFRGVADAAQPYDFSNDVAAAADRYQAYLDQLPDDWVIRTLGEVATVVGGGTPSRETKSFWNGDIPWVTPGEVSKEQSKYIAHTTEQITTLGLGSSGANLLPAGALLVTTRATLGARVIAAVPMATNQGFKSLVFPAADDADFYYYMASKLKPELVRRASGTTFLEISSREFSRIEVPCPSHGERQWIARVLDTLDTAIRQTEAIIAKLKQVKQGLLHDLLTRGIDANGELRPPQPQAPHLYKQSPLGWIPREWKNVPLREVATPEREGFIDGDWIEAPYITNSGIRLVQTGNVGVGTFLDKGDRRKYISKATFRQLGCKWVLPGDLLICRLADPIGRACIIPGDVGPAITAVDCTIARVRTDVFDKQFVLAWLNSEAALKRAEDAAAGSTRSRISRSNLGKQVIAQPSLDEQKKIAAQLQAVDERLRLEEERMEKMGCQKSGLMDDLLTGRVRVTPLLEAVATP